MKMFALALIVIGQFQLSIAHGQEAQMKSGSLTLFPAGKLAVAVDTTLNEDGTLSTDHVTELSTAPIDGCANTDFLNMGDCGDYSPEGQLVYEEISSKFRILPITVKLRVKLNEGQLGQVAPEKIRAAALEYLNYQRGFTLDFLEYSYEQWGVETKDSPLIIHNLDVVDATWSSANKVAEHVELLIKLNLGLGASYNQATSVLPSASSRADVGLRFYSKAAISFFGQIDGKYWTHQTFDGQFHLTSDELVKLTYGANIQVVILPNRLYLNGKVSQTKNWQIINGMDSHTPDSTTATLGLEVRWGKKKSYVNNGGEM